MSKIPTGERPAAPTEEIKETKELSPEQLREYLFRIFDLYQAFSHWLSSGGVENLIRDVENGKEKGKKKPRKAVEIAEEAKRQSAELIRKIQTIQTSLFSLITRLLNHPTLKADYQEKFGEPISALADIDRVWQDIARPIIDDYHNFRPLNN